ncbi:MAG: Exodeoxyribonuclease III [uncultured Rubrobacteraceae bacterium]|uniref:Exodeoxyribonuclease III n=1 Tax=uncultured Rubrobacteraceae bacterium TaxID=349277 RepID=A0A6J4R721_9ACTN|nr:MAG: Exodeoxyribonuclease III [uncultured Rubrobacteraceae bacterium]
MVDFAVMTWNVENLFAPGPGAERGERHAYGRKLGLLASVIRKAGPDVVALQEVGGEDALRELGDTLDGDYPHGASSAFPDGRGIRVAFLSSHAFEATEDFADFPPGPALEVSDLPVGDGSKPVKRMGRGALRVRVRKESFTVDLLTAHLKSKLLSFPRPWGMSFAPRDEDERAQAAGVALHRRAAEAVTVRMRANELLEWGEIPLVLLGDLNDVPEAQTSLLLNGPPGSQIGSAGFGRPDEGDAFRLFNLAPLIPEGRRYSRVHEGRGELLDQVLVSEGLLPESGDGERRLPEVDALVDFRDGLPSVGGDPAKRQDDAAPDHAPVVAAFAL